MKPIILLYQHEHRFILKCSIVKLLFSVIIKPILVEQIRFFVNQEIAALFPRLYSMLNCRLIYKSISTPFCLKKSRSFLVTKHLYFLTLSHAFPLSFLH